MQAVLHTLRADVLALQETKCEAAELSHELATVPGYQSYWSFNRKASHRNYSGVALYVRHELTPHAVEEGLAASTPTAKAHDHPTKTCSPSVDVATWLSAHGPGPSAREVDQEGVRSNLTPHLCKPYTAPSPAPLPAAALPHR